MDKARFFGSNDPAPGYAPPWMVVVASGAYGCSTKEQALEIARQLRANRCTAKVVRAIQEGN